jgi:hypothetical protein
VKISRVLGVPEFVEFDYDKEPSRLDSTVFVAMCLSKGPKESRGAGCLLRVIFSGRLLGSILGVLLRVIFSGRLLGSILGVLLRVIFSGRLLGSILGVLLSRRSARLCPWVQEQAEQDDLASKIPSAKFTLELLPPAPPHHTAADSAARSTPQRLKKNRQPI